MDDEPEVSEEVDVEDEPYSVMLTVLSFLRQLFCISGVMLLPFHHRPLHFLKHQFMPDSFKHNYQLFVDMLRFLGQSKSTMPALYIFMGAIFVQLAGRKLMVVLCNFSYLFLTIFTYYFYYRKQNLNFGLFVAIYVSIAEEFTIMICHVYAAEIANTTTRLFFMGMYIFVYRVGEWTMESYLTNNWHIQSLLLLSIGVASFSSFVSIFVPETPFWLASKGNQEAAEETYMWIRAERGSAADLDEFDLLLDAAQDRKEMGLARQIFSRTFFLCCSFAVFLRICTSAEACDVQRLAMNDYYIPPMLSDPNNYETVDVYFDIWNRRSNIYKNMFLGCLIFTVAGLVVPRKIIFILFLVFGYLLAVPALQKYKDLEGLARISLLCYIATFSGVIQLELILPAEVFPATSREFGIAAAASFGYFMNYVEEKLSTPLRTSTLIVEHIERKTIYFSLVASLVGIPYLFFFMPETMGRTMYDFKEIIPFYRYDAEDDENSPEELEDG